MAKSYFVQEYRLEGEMLLYSPHIVLLSVDPDTFILELYEKLYAFMATGKDIESNDFVEVCGVSVRLEDVLKQGMGQFNYEIKEPDIIDLDSVEPIKIGERGGNLFMMEKREYLPDTEDDFNIRFIPIEIDSQKTFEDEFRQACEKYARRGEIHVEFYDLYFSMDDVCEFERNKLTVFYPRLTVIPQ